MSKPKAIRAVRETQPEDSGRPFGTEPRRSPLPMYVVLALFVAWVGVLLYIALTQVGLKQ